MPYIDAASRSLLRPHTTADAEAAGELNFQITKLVDKWLSNGLLSYAKINAAIGVLECAKLELYRRIAAPYEDQKCQENGDVYDCDKR